MNLLKREYLSCHNRIQGAWPAYDIPNLMDDHHNQKDMDDETDNKENYQLWLKNASEQ
jgi:hypothetical protein